MQRILIIGLGGIGGSLAEPLARYLAYSGADKELALVDGDRYERKNQDRQNITAIDSGRHKADVWAGVARPEGTSHIYILCDPSGLVGRVSPKPP